MAVNISIYSARAGVQLTVKLESQANDQTYTLNQLRASGSGLYWSNRTFGSDGSTFTVPERVSGTNYFLDGWYVGPNENQINSSTVSSFTDLVSTSTSLDGPTIEAQTPAISGNANSARHICVKYSLGLKVTFNYYSGTSSTSSTQYVRSGGSATEPSNKDNRTGYDFVRWDRSLDNITSDVTITAVYAPKTATIALVANGGTFGWDSDTDASIDTVPWGVTYDSPYGHVGANSALYIRTPTRHGYTFKEWRLNNNNSSAYLVTPSTICKSVNSSNTLVARWTQEALVLLDANGGNVYPVYVRVPAGGTYGTLPTPTRSGYSFVNWYTASTGGTVVDSSTALATTSTHTLYAHWTPEASSGVTVTVTFDPNQGRLTSSTTATVTTGGAYGTLPTPTRTGYTFNGWYTAPAGGTQVTPSTVVTTDFDHTLYAQWVGDSVTYRLDANGGTVSPTTVSVRRGETFGWLPVPVYAGHVFAGWYQGDHRGQDSNAWPVSSNRVPLYSTTVLYAHWMAAQATLTPTLIV